jgi:pimeloyl-ACP methyl ester carboxylesterase
MSHWLKLPMIGMTTIALAHTGCVAPRTGEPVSHFADLDGKRVHYIDAGKGETTLVWVHGWASDTTVWRDQIPAFKDKARSLVIDLPGHGQSDPVGKPYTMDLFAHGIAAAMDDAGVERGVLIGHSNGTPTIRQFYRRYPERTQALVCIDGALRPMMPPEAAKPFLERFKAADYQETAGNMVDQMPLVDDGLRERVHLLVRGTSQEAMVGGLEAAMDQTIWTDDAIACPMLCVMAASPFWTEDYVEFVRGLNADVDYRVLDGVSHFIMMEQPERFNAILEEFLAARHLIN